MTFCDHDHEAVEVRYLPLSEDSGVHICKEHYEEEMEYRCEMQWSHTFDHFPAWVTLKKIEYSSRED
jgi:hypothetical protein